MTHTDLGPPWKPEGHVELDSARFWIGKELDEPRFVNEFDYRDLSAWAVREELPFLNDAKEDSS